MSNDEQRRLRTLILGLGGYARAADTISDITSCTVWPFELQRAVNTGHLSPKLRRALLPPPPRHRVAIDCADRDEQQRLADLLRGDDGRRVSAAELIDTLERIQ